MKQIKNGYFEVVNPYNRHVSIVPASPDKVHTILFWSKNFGPFIKNGFGEKLRKTGFNLYFNFTINSEEPLLEPDVPALEERIRQLEYLCKNFGADSISWRFDPVCFYKTKDGKIHDNLHDFNYISSKASKYGIKRCITSFMDDYHKIRKRVAKIPGFAFIHPPIETKSKIVLKMKDELSDKNISLHTCCEKELLSILPENSGITKSSCIPNDLLMKLFGGSLSLNKDFGQRIKNGCGCKVSADIGSYSLHPCYHNCLFCYANPASGANHA
ncbi:MAG: DUF1848 domain-containing protein [Deltaproteobacteria bacterium]|nr:DUF1848 domain-containing protein [Deltaproteobacteria bacterium]